MSQIISWELKAIAGEVVSSRSVHLITLVVADR